MIYKTRPSLPFTVFIPNPFYLYEVINQRVEKNITPIFIEAVKIDNGSWGLAFDAETLPLKGKGVSGFLGRVFGVVTNTGGLAVKTHTGMVEFKNLRNRRAFKAAIEGSTKKLSGSSELGRDESVNEPEIELSDRYVFVPMLPQGLISYGKQSEYLLYEGKSGSVLSPIRGKVALISNDVIRIQLPKDFTYIGNVSASDVYWQIMDIIQQRSVSGGYLHVLDDVKIPVVDINGVPISEYPGAKIDFGNTPL